MIIVAQYLSAVYIFSVHAELWLAWCPVIYSDDLTDAYFQTVRRILMNTQRTTTLVMSLERR